MAGKVRMVCSKCNIAYKVKKAVPGDMPLCAKCGGVLVFEGKARLACGHCHARTKPGKIDLSRKISCPRCKSRMHVEVHVEAAPATVGSAVDPHDRTVRMEPSRESGTGVDSEGATMMMPGPGKAGAGVEPVIGAESAGSGVAGRREAETGADDSLALQPLDAGDDAPGRIRKARFGKYEIREEIARGGMGIVYKAYDPRLRRNVALKVLIAGEGASEDSIRRFLREARAAGQLKNPHVVSVHEVGEESGQFYYTMDLVQGCDLGEMIDAGRSDIGEMLRYMRDICLALQAAHDKGIIHRDLKPQNIMIDQDDNALIMDFGLAKDLTSDSIQSMTGSVFGTPAYMSPEQARGRTREIDHRSDIYSMGVILYEIATGERPFEGNTVFDTIQAVVNQDPRQPREVSPRIAPDLNTIILKCLEKEPASRYQCMRDLAADLERFLAGDAISARPVSAPVRAWRGLRRRPALLGACVGVPALVLVAVVVYLVFAGDMLGSIEDEVRSGDPKRAHAALSMLGSMLEQGKVNGSDDMTRALAIARAVIDCRARDQACIEASLEILVSAHDRASLPAMLQYAVNKELPTRQREAVLAAMGSIGPGKAVELGAMVRGMAGMLADQEEDLSVRKVAAAGLAVFRSRDARRALRECAKNNKVPESLRVMAIHSLGRHVSLQGPAMMALLELQADESAAVAGAAEAVLSRARTRMSVFDLYGIKRNVAAALQSVGRVQQLNARHQRELMDLADDPLGERRRRRKKAEPPVRKMLGRLTDADAKVRMAAAYDLGVLGDAGAIGPLQGSLEDDDNGVRCSAARALLKILARNPRAEIDVSRVTRLLDDAEMLKRVNAAFLLGGLEEKTAVQPLAQALLRERSPRAARAMVRALSGIRGNAAMKAIVAAMKQRKTDSDFCVVCIRALARFGGAAAGYVKPMQQATSPRVRRAAENALKEIRR